VWDLQDNDCDGQVDEDGLQYLTRWHKEWDPAADWEHRFKSTQPSGFSAESHYVKLYPLNICTTSPYSSTGCSVSTGAYSGKVATVRGSQQLTELGECTGQYGTSGTGSHVTLYLPTTSSEYDDYHHNNNGQNPNFSCQPVGYVYVGMSPPAAFAPFYRLRACFCAGGLHDNMWSTSTSEGGTHSPYAPSATDNGVQWYAPSGY
jgi:hypothetical protein